MYVKTKIWWCVSWAGSTALRSLTLTHTVLRAAQQSAVNSCQKYLVMVDHPVSPMIRQNIL